MAPTNEERAYVKMISASWRIVSQRTETPQDRAAIVTKLRKALRAYSTAARQVAGS